MPGRPAPYTASNAHTCESPHGNGPQTQLSGDVGYTIGTRWRKIRDIAARKARTALVGISIFIGVLGGRPSTMGQLLTRQMQRDLRTNELAMFRIFLDTPNG